ncbi:hypothetical protein [Crocinitomix algicola]|uniref:hypothetical protein n=1 Tax=Crocinitomix algicola TaxID=1740263 RepID=UPI000872C9A2|nr:hypothetical protein [Crocinitomix algicola]
MQIRKTQIYGLFFLLFWSCTTQVNEKQTSHSEAEPSDIVFTRQTLAYEQESVIAKPFKDIDVPYEILNYNSNRGLNTRMPSGTTINIPPDAFKIDPSKFDSKNIKIHYREMHDIVDIILTGIKMDYNGSDFETAGMFEIRAYADHEELALKPGKEISVQLGSYRNGHFDHFYMNEEKKQWELLPHEKPKINQAKKDALTDIRQDQENAALECFAEPRVFNPNEEYFDLNLPNNFNHSLFSGAMWVLTKPEEERERFLTVRNEYDKINIVPTDSCGNYQLLMMNKSLNNKEEQVFSVAPVWRGKQLDKVKKEYKASIREYKKRLAALEAANKVANKEAEILRGFRVNRMGIYNCDRTIEYLSLIPAAIVLTCKKKIMSWWYITNNKQIAIKYYSPEYPDFKYNPYSESSIIAILEDGSVATADSEMFHDAIDQLKANEKKIHIHFEESSQPIMNKKDFVDCLASN